MNNLKTVREVLGISQKDLARILGISLSLLKQVETGRRNLPMGAWNMLSSISAFVGKIDHQKKPDVPPVSDSWKDLYLLTVRTRLGNVELEMKKWETKQKQAESLIKIAKALRTGTTQTISPGQAKCLDALEYETGFWLEATNQTPYWDLVLRKEGLLAVLKRLEEM